MGILFYGNNQNLKGNFTFEHNINSWISTVINVQWLTYDVGFPIMKYKWLIETSMSTFSSELANDILIPYV